MPYVLSWSDRVNTHRIQNIPGRELAEIIVMSQSVVICAIGTIKHGPGPVLGPPGLTCKVEIRDNLMNRFIGVVVELIPR